LCVAVLTVRRAGTYIGRSPSLGSLTAQRSCSVRGCRRHRYQTIARRLVGRFLQVQRRKNCAIFWRGLPHNFHTGDVASRQVVERGRALEGPNLTPPMSRNCCTAEVTALLRVTRVSQFEANAGVSNSSG